MSKFPLDPPMAFQAVHGLLDLAEATLLVQEHALLVRDSWRAKSVRIRSLERGQRRIPELVDDSSVCSALLRDIRNESVPDASALQEKIRLVESCSLSGPAFERVLEYARGVRLMLAKEKDRPRVIGFFRGPFLEEGEFSAFFEDDLHRELEREQIRHQAVTQARKGNADLTMSVAQPPKALFDAEELNLAAKAPIIFDNEPTAWIVNAEGGWSRDPSNVGAHGQSALCYLRRRLLQDPGLRASNKMICEESNEPQYSSAQAVTQALHKLRERPRTGPFWSNVLEPSGETPAEWGWRLVDPRRK